MCHSCVSRNPGCFMTAPVLRWSKRGRGNMHSFFLDSHLRGNDTREIEPARGQSSSFIRLSIAIRKKQRLPHGKRTHEQQFYSIMIKYSRTWTFRRQFRRKRFQLMGMFFSTRCGN